ncbi:MAG: pitrilysin family protein [Hyphomicrobiaceae bacterium]|nr:pitrilysin family protein [Hyphomicrobiaceae bacterium]
MTTNITTLSNGLRVVTHDMPHLETVSLGVWVAAGSRHEPEPLHGISHLLEHMAFKGTATRSAQRIAEEIEEVGGDLNAATSLETTSYYARVLKGDASVALGLISDILQDSVFDPAELEREREVILQEIAAYQDSPEDVAYDLVQEAAFPEQPVGRTILGTAESVRDISRAALADYLGEHYGSPRIVLAAAGGVDHDAVVRQAESLFSGLGGTARGADDSAHYKGGIRASAKPFEQGHVVLGFEAPAYGQPNYLAMQVLAGVLGGGMSSRLFQEVREKRGLCYSIYASAWGLSDTGMISVHAATTPEQLAELIAVTADEIVRLAEHGATAAEVQRAKAQLKVGLMMGLESSSARAEQMARHLIAYGRLVGQDELAARVEAVTAEDVGLLCQGMVVSPPAVAVVGAGNRSHELAEQAAARFVPPVKH